MEPAYGPATAFSIRISFKHVGSEVLCMRVVDGVHADCSWTVVFGDCHGTTKAHFQPGTGAATAAEEVHYDLIVLLIEAKAVLGFEIEGVFLLLSWHRWSSPIGMMLKICGFQVWVRYSGYLVLRNCR